jgi:hypothetical protein
MNPRSLERGVCMSTLKSDSPGAENQFHNYVTNRIPWYVRLVWIGFWIFAVYYTMQYLIPALRKELVIPPPITTT